uniref:Uncharacterized protein n=1 Tax=Ditylenchus dipsaci TaxID=166011 RepID=A0A915D0F8_9BILA
MAAYQLEQPANEGIHDNSGQAIQQQNEPSQVHDLNAMFLRAARAGQLEKVLDFLKNGVDINTSNSNGLNALHLASKEGHNDVVRELIRRGATVDAATKDGDTALHLASMAGQDTILTILVENKANVNAQSLNYSNSIDVSTQTYQEEIHQHMPAYKDEDFVGAITKSGFTPLHFAAYYGNESVAKLLLEKGAYVNSTALQNITPLHVASKWGHVNLVSLLLARGACTDSRDADSFTPLHYACWFGHCEVVKIFLDKSVGSTATVCCLESLFFYKTVQQIRGINLLQIRSVRSQDSSQLSISPSNQPRKPCYTCV